MTEVIFLVEDAPEGGYTARALGEPIFTEAEDLASLHEQVRGAVRCHFEEKQQPKVVRLLAIEKTASPLRISLGVRLMKFNTLSG